MLAFYPIPRGAAEVGGKEREYKRSRSSCRGYHFNQFLYRSSKNLEQGEGMQKKWKFLQKSSFEPISMEAARMGSKKEYRGRGSSCRGYYFIQFLKKQLEQERNKELQRERRLLQRLPFNQFLYSSSPKWMWGTGMDYRGSADSCKGNCFYHFLQEHLKWGTK